MSGVAVVVMHDDEAVLRALVGVVDGCDDLYVAGTEVSDVARVIVAGGRALDAMRPPLAAPLVALAESGSEIRAARAALAVGARDIVRWPEESHRLPGAARLAAATHAGAGVGIVTAIIGARGGVGTTTAALAFAIHTAGIVVDRGGGGCDILRAEPAEPFPPVAPALIDRALESLPSDARLLAADRVPPDATAAVSALRALTPNVIVDRGRDAAHANDADRVVVACADDVASARGLRRLAASGAHPDLVLVRKERRSGVAVRDLAAIAGGAPCVVIPNDGHLGRSLDLGRWPSRATRGVRAFGAAWQALSP